ncbi:site-specific integrase [Flaviaesturariibacter aridisoli]|uniref:Site-specific integrase n=1 Tax=Flaviaesturariibacter aridisoli TaxID=2545761 RepID=A0A4R4E730_9BACT|nr:site-specific integrase [Flaviaesturariibacter aridisoli]TCZ73831.1 site-specific integrase [Flaviaesturariibacter aridisoli]
MGRRNLKGSVSIDQDKNRIRLRWRYGGKRYSLNLYTYSAPNLKLARKVAVQIESDILNGSFDVTLTRYGQGQVRNAPRHLLPHQLLEEWVTDYLNRDCEKQVDYWALRNMVKRWGNFHLPDAVKHFNAEKINERTYNRRLTMLSKFYSWLKDSGKVLQNPFEQVRPKRTSKAQNRKRVPFTENEIHQILEAVRTDSACPASSRFKHSHYYPFLYFIFATGVRNAEAVGLRVKSIDMQRKVVLINEVLARGITSTNAGVRVRKTTKNGKERAIPLSPDLAAILALQMAHKQPDDLVFYSPKGHAIDDRMFQRRVFKPILKALNIEDRDLYACRHTFGSRCIDAGLTPVMTAFLLGNNPITTLRTYTHQVSLPSSVPDLRKGSDQDH